MVNSNKIVSNDIDLEPRFSALRKPHLLVWWLMYISRTGRQCRYPQQDNMKRVETLGTAEEES